MMQTPIRLVHQGRRTKHTPHSVCVEAITSFQLYLSKRLPMGKEPSILPTPVVMKMIAASAVVELVRYSRSGSVGLSSPMFMP